MTFEYSDAVKNGCLAAIAAEAGVGVTDGEIHVLDESGALLAVAALADPPSTHDSENIRLSFNLAVSVVQALGTGRASSARIVNGDAAPVVSMPCAEGNAPISGYCVLDSLDVVEGVEVEFAVPVIEG